MTKGTHGGKRIPGPGKKLGPAKKPESQKYRGIYVKLPPDLLEWLRENVDNRNGFIVEAIREKIEKREAV